MSALLPWPFVTFYASEDALTGRYAKPTNILRMISILRKATDSLRYLGVMILGHFFVIIPIIYVLRGDGVVTYTAIGLGYTLTLIASFFFYNLHKKFLPAAKEERFKGTLLTALLPWHAMRSADEILVNCSLPWSKVALLAANAQNDANLLEIKKFWRNAHFSPSPQYKTTELKKVLENAKIDYSDWFKAPLQIDDSQYYCPCCHVLFANYMEFCSDCEGVKLVSFSSEEN